MDIRDRVDSILATKVLNDRDFERCAYHFLKAVYPGLTPITGGSDLGRDADAGPLPDGPRLLATVGVPMANLKKGIARMREEGIRFGKGVILATSRVVHGTERQKLAAEVRSAGSRLKQVHDRTWLADELQYDGYWRRRLLELTSEPAALVPRPIELRNYGEDLDLVGRLATLHLVNNAAYDLIVVGPPGIGKTRLLAEGDRVVFLEHDPDPSRLAEDLDELKPALVVVEEAARRVDDLRLLHRMRTEESHRKFRIAATAWPDEVDFVKQRLEGANQFELSLLERQDMDRILRQLGITGYWHRSAILDQAGGRPGWGVVLAKTAVAGGTQDIFDGQALARHVERYLQISGDHEIKRRVLAHVALYDGVAEEDLGILARRLDARLPEITRALHSTTHNGILERSAGTWRVRPEALRVALIDRWFLAPDALEPMSVLIREYADEEATFVSASLQAALRGSPGGANISRSRVPTLTQGVGEGQVPALKVLGLYAELDEEAARWAVHERVRPALADQGCPEFAQQTMHKIVERAVERFQLSEAVEILLDESLVTSRRVNDPGHPLRLLGEAALRIIPDVRPDPRRRTKIFRAALDWVDRNAGADRLTALAQLTTSVLSPYASGIWDDPGRPMTFTLTQGVDAASTLTLIGEQLWPEIQKRLSAMPDDALISIGDLVSSWLLVAEGVGPLQEAVPNVHQRKAAKGVAGQMVAALEERVRSAPGLAVRLRHLFSRRAKFQIDVDRDFQIITSESPGTSGWPALERRLRAVARRWKREEPAAVLRRLKEWEPQLRLAGLGMTFEQHVMGMLAEEVPDVARWAEETVGQGVVAGAAVFYQALKQCSKRLPRWFTAAVNDDRLRFWALLAALRPGVEVAVAMKALAKLGKDDAAAIRQAIVWRDSADAIVAGLLRHPVREIQGIAALDLGPPDDRPIKLGDDDQAAWENAIINYQPESAVGHIDYELGRSLAFLAGAKPERVAGWFKQRLTLSPKLGFTDALPHQTRDALRKLPGPLKIKLLEDVPSYWRRLLFHEGIAGEEADWVLEAVDAGRLTVVEASDALEEASFEAFKRVAPELVRRGLHPSTAVVNMELGIHSGEESAFYADLLAKCEELANSTDADLASIGQHGVNRYAARRDDALRREHRERVFGL